MRLQGFEMILSAYFQERFSVNQEQPLFALKNIGLGLYHDYVVNAVKRLKGFIDRNQKICSCCYRVHF